jgi:hypothetical protein
MSRTVTLLAIPSLLLCGGSVARADYLEPGPAIGGCPAGATNCVDTRVNVNGTLKSCGQLTSQELVDLDATLHTKVRCQSQGCYVGSACNTPGAPSAPTPSTPICCFDLDGCKAECDYDQTCINSNCQSPLPPCRMTKHDTPSTSAAGTQISCTLFPPGPNCVNSTQSSTNPNNGAFHQQFFDCYGCYDPNDHSVVTDPKTGVVLDPNDPGTRYAVARFTAQQCDLATGTVQCNYVGGLLRVRGNIYNHCIDDHLNDPTAACPLPQPTNQQFPPKQQQLEQVDDTAGCYNDIDPAHPNGRPECGTRGCGPQQDLTIPAAQSTCSVVCITPGCANSQCPVSNPHCASACTVNGVVNTTCLAACSAAKYTNWECVKVNGTPTCVIDKTPSYRDTTFSSAVRQQADNAGSTYGIGLVVGSASNFSDDCGVPSESLAPDTRAPWFNRTTLGDRPRHVCWGDTSLALGASELPTARDLGNWVQTCSDSVPITCEPLTLTPPTTAEALYSTTCYATDMAGNQQTTALGIHVQADDTPPTITCPADVILECDAPGGTSRAAGTANAIDDCPVAVSHPPSSFPLGITPVQHSASDGINTSTCWQQVTVQDTKPPIITCPADVVAECTGPSTAIDTGNATASDVCSTVIVIDPPATAYPLGTTALTHTATDTSGNRSGCSQQVTIVDTTPPTITCPADVTAECDSPAGKTFSAGVATATDSCTATTVTNPGAATYPLGTTSLTYAASDGANNSSVCSQGVTVRDTTPPTFVLASLADQTVVGNQSGAPVAITIPTATDACTSAVAVTCDPVAGNSFMTNHPTCTATDGSGNTTTATLTVNVLEPLQVVFDSPLSGATGTFTVGRTIPLKVRLFEGGQDVTSSADVTVRLAVSAGTGGVTNLTSDLDFFSGSGDAGGLMVLLGEHYQFNLDTTGYTSGGKSYDAQVTVFYSVYPTLTVGQATAVLQSR